MVLGVLPVRRARQPPEGEVEADGVELPLVVAVRRVAADLPSSPRDDVRGRAVDVPLTAPGALVDEGARTAQPGDDEPVPDPRQHVGVAAEPGEGPDRAGREEEAVREAPAEQGLRLRATSIATAIPERLSFARDGMAHVGADHHLLGALPRQHQLPVGQLARLEGRVDDDLVRPLVHRPQLLVGEAEPPVPVVVRRPVRDPVRPVGQRVQMRTQLARASWWRAPGRCS